MVYDKLMKAFSALERLKRQEMQVSEAIKIHHLYAQLRVVRDEYAAVATEIASLIAETDENGRIITEQGVFRRRTDADDAEFTRRMAELNATEIEFVFDPVELFLEDGKLTPEEIEILMEFFIFE